jgi:NhaP-type Na+/H+ or K+/H+ antiporter
VVEPVTRPVEPDSRRIVVRAVVGFLLGAMLGMVAAFFLEFGRSRREAGDTTYADLVALRRQAAEDLRRPWRLLRRSAS